MEDFIIKKLKGLLYFIVVLLIIEVVPQVVFYARYDAIRKDMQATFSRADYLNSREKQTGTKFEYAFTVMQKLTILQYDVGFMEAYKRCIGPSLEGGLLLITAQDFMDIKQAELIALQKKQSTDTMKKQYQALLKSYGFKQYITYLEQSNKAFPLDGYNMFINLDKERKYEVLEKQLKPLQPYVMDELAKYTAKRNIGVAVLWVGYTSICFFILRILRRLFRRKE